MAAANDASLTGMTAGEARDFHRIFVKSAIAFTGWAFAAHVLVHFWRPWLYNQGAETSSLIDGVTTALSAFV
ncbi:MAG: light-harvesting antenna LH1, beta subunit [Pseudomonadota bacterium]